MKSSFRIGFYIVIISLVSCSPPATEYLSDEDAFNHVDPFIGTGGHGHTYPGASMPFGMMQLSPDTRLDGWDGCSGYHYSDSHIYGFTHTHLSGTGVSDYGDILLMPTTSVIFNNGANGEPGYKAPFSHENEFAEPGFYEVLLDSTNIKVELTVSKRSGVHRYTFEKDSPQVIIIDLEHRDEVLDSKLNRIDSTEISGYRHSSAWATNQQLYFHMKLSKPFSRIEYLEGKSEGKKVKAALIFESLTPELEIRVGISAVDEEGAKKNLDTEIGSASFDEIRMRAKTDWMKQFNKIQVLGESETDVTNFYTSMYHSMLAPNLYHDVDGRYRGMDLKVHQNTDFDYYTVFSLWDTYRATHPLYTIIEQDRTNDFVNTLLTKYKEGGIMPIWDLSACYTGCMIGYHGVPVIADAYLKGIRGYDVNLALEAMKHSANQDHLGLDSYKKFGFIPGELESESVSKTLEYAYDDWCIAQMAKEMGKMDDYEVFIKRAQNYKNVFDPSTGFMRAKFRNKWFEPFDPYEVNFNYTEANAWQYRFYVPQDITGLMNLLGGPKVLESQLDSLFTAKVETSGRDQADITGLIGQYAHGNEPSHHMAYLYNFVGRPQKTMERVVQIRDELYTDQPDGISGNEDCGQMSAWYIFSSMGFYPVTPGSNTYILSTPLFKRAKINLENGNTFEIVAKGLSAENIYIQTTQLNGEYLEGSYITHDAIMKGGRLEFQMTSRPFEWMNKKGKQSKTSIDEHLIVPTPFIKSGELAFKRNTQVELGTIDQNSQIHWKFNKAKFEAYTKPITIEEEGILSFYSERNGVKSAVLTTEFRKIDPLISIELGTSYANQYNGGGNDALIDGITGTLDFRTGTWQGYQDQDVVATIDLGKERAVNMVDVNFLEDQRSWIFLPTEVSCYGSLDNENFIPIEIAKSLESNTPKEDPSISRVYFKQPGTTFRYIKLIAKTPGDLPDWHIGSRDNGKAWIFIDEIRIR